MTEPHAVLTGQKVMLARIRREDIAEMARCFANLELTAYLGAVGVSYSLEDEQAYYERGSKNTANSVHFGIYELSSQRYIGGIDLRSINHQHGTAELGVSIQNPAFWGEGYGREAVQLMVEYGMFFLGLHNIMLNVFSVNTRGIRAYQKVGFREIGRRRGVLRLGNERYDGVLMDITADEVDTSRMRAYLTLLPAPEQPE